VPITEEEYKIYGTVLDSLHSDTLQYILVITDSTAPNYFKSDARYFSEGKWFAPNELEKARRADSSMTNSDFDELSNNYEFMNEQKFYIRLSSINTLRKLKQVTSDSLKRIFEIDQSRNWVLFHKMFPNSVGLIRLSRVGFNLQKNRAVLFMSCTNGGLDGTGTYIILRKSGLSWQISATAEDWVS